ncbi:hypothetical protein SAMN05444392_104185 [Seinonella peptonophila]|uniref:Uncharacterized protein n=1 Tax=Seinonella peptonophila TaxID=112248 RepID=A0A1M4X921_9BACL|nr:hypothetical protein [Seinonella peptonophila]SHE89602.1 hypothetical protein SAMN05444392_104185 [Seinonella peptonophila]
MPKNRDNYENIRNSQKKILRDAKEEAARASERGDHDKARALQIGDQVLRKSMEQERSGQSGSGDNCLIASIVLGSMLAALGYGGHAAVQKLTSEKKLSPIVDKLDQNTQAPPKTNLHTLQRNSPTHTDITLIVPSRLHQLNQTNGMTR